ncbi:hypothetical protein Pan241w_11070 [Gimesia alba]|uniref:HTH cro/C1-type domain-containing protein n=1 Tax=Gimesia alba TaxID=2527973 RepID=A0A517RB00_9PLAN|nr:helix-turn-helix domain-containing protein [Gimesia alba]QDT41048.1 hypothetical protein Pan241w_11070 [Gimesia alba]
MARPAQLSNVDNAKETLRQKKKGTVSYVLLDRVIKKMQTGMTLYELASEVSDHSKISVAQPTLHRWVTGTRENINIQTVDALAKYFDLNLK